MCNTMMNENNVCNCISHTQMDIITPASSHLLMDLLWTSFNLSKFATLKIRGAI